MRAVGLSPARRPASPASEVERTLLRVALVSGAVAGIAGVSEVAGIQFRLTAGVSPGFGYTGIVVAMLGGLTMPGVLVAGLLLGDLAVGASLGVRSLQIPSQLGAVVQGTLLLVVVGALALYRRRARPRAGPSGRRGRAASPRSRMAVRPRSAADMTFLADLLAATFRNATPLVYGTVGETYAERAGILNLGIEGTMYAGAFSGFAVAHGTGRRPGWASPAPSSWAWPRERSWPS